MPAKTTKILLLLLCLCWSLWHIPLAAFPGNLKGTQVAEMDSTDSQAYKQITLIKELNQAEHYEKAQEESEKLFNQYRSLLQKDKKLLREAYYERAYTASGMHQQKLEIEHTLKALSVMENDPGLFPASDFIQIFNDLYYYQHNYDDKKGMADAYRRYLAYFNKNKTALDSETFGYARRVLRKMEISEALNGQQPQLALEILSRFLAEVMRPFNKYDIEYLNSCYSTINSYYYFAGEYAEAIAFGKQYLDFARQTGSKFDIMLAYSKIGTSYERTSNYQEAIYNIDLSIRAFPFGQFSASLFALQIIKAKCFSGLKKHDKAIHLAEQTIEQILSHKLKKRAKILDFEIAQIVDLHSHNYINIFASAGLLFIERYKQDSSKTDLLKAEKILRTSTAMFREFYLKGAYNPTLYNLHSKNAEGLLYIATEKYKEDPGAVTGILNLIEENASKHLYRQYQRKAGGSEIHRTDRLDTDRDNLEKLMEQIQQKLEPDEQILKYYVLSENIYRCNITAGKISLHRLAKTEYVQKILFGYLKDIKDIKLTYKQNGRLLVQLLFPEKTRHKISIVSDNFLNYLPFEALPTPSMDGYMVRQYDFSYAYSLAVWLWNRNTMQETNQRPILIFNPDYPAGSSYQGQLLSPLPHSKLEAQEISRLMSASIISNNVKKQDFLNRLDKYGVYHFSMHAYLDEDNFNQSCLLFSNNEPLFFEELYQMEIPADMVVLGACNTGNGKLKNGEGIMSLSMAFSFAGTRSGVYSLWEVPDAETAEILGYFYKNLKKGLPKDEALAAAKTTFIDVNPMKTHPFFWAGFIVNGDISPLRTKPVQYWGLTGGVAVLALLLAWIGLRKKRAR